MSAASYPPPLTEKAVRQPGAQKSFLTNIAARREFRLALAGPASKNADNWAGFGGRPAALVLPGLQLTGAQQFVRDFAGPNTEFSRLLVKWQTGAGKSIGAISICHEFALQYRARAQVGDRVPHVTILGFTTRETILEDMLRFPEFGFVSAAEFTELRRLRLQAGDAAAGAGAVAAIRQLAGFLGVLRRRVTDRGRGGYYQFYGYKEFANRLFRVTRAALARGFDSDSQLFSRVRLGTRASDPFGARLAEAVRRGDVEVDRALLESLRGGLLICDEIHNVYNILEPNNYGMAIQYALDALGDAAPRTVFLSATPVTGSAAEVVDLLNLLVPRSALPDATPLRRSDFFTRRAQDEDDETVETRIAVSRLLPDALERIRRLAAGRISFLLDADIAAYPRRIFVGDLVPAVPYLQLTLCVNSPLLARTLRVEQDTAQARRAATKAPVDVEGATRGLSADAYSLNDIAYPNPAFANPAENDTIGLYRSGDTASLLAAAPADWREAAGVIVEPPPNSHSPPIITGTWLRADQLARYSTKYSRLLTELIAVLRAPAARSGKIMVYHHRVAMSGVLLVAEVLRMNGFATETSEPTEQTLCALCGAPRFEHAAANQAANLPEKKDNEHLYTPARFALAHSNIDRAEMLRSISRFNSAENIDGRLLRILVGSKIVREGLNFRAVRHLFVLSMPTDYPTLLQVFGRVVRKDSHKELPPAERDVHIRVLVSVLADTETPELQRYIDKGQEFLVIQQVEQALHAGAVDGYVNYRQITTALGAPPEAARPSLDALPFQVELGPTEALALAPSSITFDAYGYGMRLVNAALGVCRALFAARPVWTFPDLWRAVRAGAAHNSGVAPAAFTEESVAAALIKLRRPAQWPNGIFAVVRAGPYYVAFAANAAGDSDLQPDVVTWLRDRTLAAPPLAHVSVSVGAYMRGARAAENFAVRLREFEIKYLGNKTPLELSLVELGGTFHYELLRRLVVAARGASRVTRNDAALVALYRRFRISVTAGEARAHSPAGEREAFAGGREIAGYVTADAVMLYMPDKARKTSWVSRPLADFKIGRRHRENNIVIGFVVPVDPSGLASAAARFKVRPPLQSLKRKQSGSVDARTIARGAVCETRPREELDDHVRRLRAVTPHSSSAPKLRSALVPTIVTASAADRADSMWPVDEGALGTEGALGDTPLSFAARHDRAREKRFPSAKQLCDAMRLYLLELEEHARQESMLDSTRWLYLFSDRPPSITALA